MFQAEFKAPMDFYYFLYVAYDMRVLWYTFQNVNNYISVGLILVTYFQLYFLDW